MSSPLLVDFARVAETSSEIQNAISRMRSSLDELERHAAPLIATWDGQARDAYVARQKAWRDASENLIETLTSVRRALDESLAQYQATEAANARFFY